MTVAGSSRPFAPTDFAAGFGAFRPPSRIQTSVLAGSEQKLLDWLCRRLPHWVTPDKLTATGVFGAALAAVGYAASNWNPIFLFLASLGLVINWFGDSLDGSLARHRDAERHRYGFFVDHSMDAVSIVVISVGLGLSPYVGMGAALFTLVGYLLLGLFVVLSNHVTGRFRLSFIGFGPTELRLMIIVFNSTLFVMGPVSVHFMGQVFSLHSASVGLIGVVLLSLFLVNVYRTATELARHD